jgi:hypothetical protein
MAERHSALPPVIEKGSAMLPSDKEMEDYASDCARLTQLAHNPELREQLMQMARDWIAAAMQESKAPEATSPLPKAASSWICGESNGVWTRQISAST